MKQGQRQNHSKYHPAMPKAEHLACHGGTYGVDVAPQTEDLRPLLGRERVIDGDPDWHVRLKQALHLMEEP
jgi:hypothetical protein